MGEEQEKGGGEEGGGGGRKEVHTWGGGVNCNSRAVWRVGRGQEAAANDE